MEEYGDLTLPDDETKTDSKISFEEQREMSSRQKKLLKRQKEFEFNEVEGRKFRKEDDLKEKKKETLFTWIISIASLLLLVGLYFWLIY